MILGYVAPSVMHSFGISMQEFAPAQSLYFFGMMLGGIVAGVISDKFGRRTTFMLGCFTFSTATILTGMTDNIYTFTLWRVVTGFAVLGTETTVLTYLAENLSSQDRSKWFGIVAGVGHISIPFIGFIAMKVVPMGPEAWRWLFYQGVLGYIPLVLAYFFMKESPRWLIANGRQAEAEAIIESYTGVAVDLTKASEQYKKTVAQKPTVLQTFKKIFGDPKYRRRTIILFLITAGQNIPSFAFLGWNTTLLQQIGVSPENSLLISSVGAVGIPLGILASGYFGPMGGRKLSLGIQMLLVGALIVAYNNVGTEVWDTMKDAIHRGLEAEGVLPGPLNLRRKASTYYIRATGYKQSLQSRGLVFSYALAVSEENASGGKIVTAPTCGSCGVMPAVLYHLQKSRDFSDMRILRALATAGLIGNIVKFNASISGAEVGCQGEVGVACAMASAAANQLFGGSPAQIEYAAEMGLEHHLGMTCDPVCGLVQIPCIERNAYAAARALDANLYSAFTDGMHRVSFDKVVQVMKQTGHDLPSLYKETSEGGLAKDYQQM